MLSPNGGEIVHIGDNYNIKWDTNFTKEHLIAVSLVDEQGKESNIASSVQNTGMYTWEVTGIKSDGSFYGPGKYKLKMTVVTDSFTSDLSDNFFSILP